MQEDMRQIIQNFNLDGDVSTKLSFVEDGCIVEILVDKKIHLSDERLKSAIREISNTAGVSSVILPLAEKEE